MWGCALSSTCSRLHRYLPVRDLAVVEVSPVIPSPQPLLKLVEKGNHIGHESRVVYFKYHRPRARPVMQDGHCIRLSGYADDSLERNFESLGRRHEIDVGGCNDELAYRLQRQVFLLDGAALGSERNRPSSSVENIPRGRHLDPSRRGSCSSLCFGTATRPVAGLVGIEVGVVSGVINLESPGVEAPGRRPRHEECYQQA